MTTKELFEFITDPTIEESHVPSYLQKMADLAEQRIQNSENVEDISDEVRIIVGHPRSATKGTSFQFFKKVYIPNKLDQVIKYEEDLEDIKQGKNVDVSATFEFVDLDWTMRCYLVFSDLLSDRHWSEKRLIRRQRTASGAGCRGRT